MTDRTTGITTRTPHYFRVFRRNADSCGHQHRTLEVAEPCLCRMKQEWTRDKSEKAKQAWAKRRFIALNDI